MYAYLNEVGTNVIVDLEGENITFDGLIELFWDCLELNITNYETGALGNDCIACSMLGNTGVYIFELRFTDRDVHRLNETGFDTFHLDATSRKIWMEDHN